MSKNLQYHLLAKMKNSPATITTGREKQKSKVNGDLLFSIKMERNAIMLSLEQANLVATPVRAKEGDTGQLSLNLRKSEAGTYSPDGKFEAPIEANLHYPLIDKIKGYKKTEGKEQDHFVPFVDTATGKIQGQILEKMDKLMAENVPEKKIKMNITLDLTAKDFPYVSQIEVSKLEVVGTAFIAYAFFKTLPIQPVFIRSGPTDTSPTGWSFDTMMQSAKCLWRKCCIFFNVLPPIYVNNASYKVLDTTTEVNNLRNEVKQEGVIEIFVAGSMSQTLYSAWGGGATWGSGTANAQIVTSDAQLQVPDPANPGKTLGAINVNHLAHELGHVMGLEHPGNAASPPMTGTGTAGTVLEPSGFYKDNPHAQSGNNCTHVGNPLFTFTLMPWASRCISNPEIP